MWCQDWGVYLLLLRAAYKNDYKVKERVVYKVHDEYFEYPRRII